MKGLLAVMGCAVVCLAAAPGAAVASEATSSIVLTNACPVVRGDGASRFIAYPVRVLQYRVYRVSCATARKRIRQWARSPLSRVPGWRCTDGDGISACFRGRARITWLWEML